MAGKGGKRGKNNILYVKPDDPSFLKQMKIDAGFKEGDTIDTKRQKLEDFEDDDYNGSDDEKPTIVVLKKGDLTKEEADKIEIENAEKKADLSERIIFKVKSKDTHNEDTVTPKPEKKEKSRKSKPSKSILSFNTEEEEESS